MDKAVIKEQLIDHNRQFKREMGGFKSFEIVFDYMMFLASEPYTVKILTPLIDYLEKEGNLLEESGDDNLQNLIIDFSSPDGLTKIPIFKDKFKIWQEDFNNKRDPNIMAAMPICFTLLSSVTCMIEEIKECQKTGKTEQAKKLIEDIKEKSLSLVDNSMIKGIEIKKMTYGQHLDIAMELVNKFIIDEIDSQALLDNEKPKKPLWFDKDNSLLYIRGQKIPITLKNDKPLDHYILEAIFAKNDLTEQTDFVEISEDTLKEDYNGKWDKFRNACDRLNRKVAKATDNKITDFIVYTTGTTGWCKINHKYL